MRKSTGTFFVVTVFLFPLIQPSLPPSLPHSDKDAHGATSSSQDLLLIPPPPFPESHVAVMKEHAKEVFVLAWNPKYDLLATG